MEKVKKAFGSLQMTCVGDVKVQAQGTTQKAYVAKVNNGTTDRVIAIALCSDSGRACNIQPMSQLTWDSFHVRSFTSSGQMASVLRSLNVNPEDLPQPQKLVGANWGNQDDIVLRAEIHNDKSKTYSSDENLPFTVTLHTNEVTNGHGNSLEVAIELIPAIQTCNFSLVAKK